MEFCIECNNILVPQKNNSQILYCRFCGKTYIKTYYIEKKSKEFPKKQKIKEPVVSKRLFAKNPY